MLLESCWFFFFFCFFGGGGWFSFFFSHTLTGLYITHTHIYIYIYIKILGAQPIMWLCHWISSKVMVILLNEHDSCLLGEEYASCEFLPWEKQVLWAYAQVVVSHIRDKHGCNTTLLTVSPKTKHPWVPVSMTKNVETMFDILGFIYQVRCYSPWDLYV